MASVSMDSPLARKPDWQGSLACCSPWGRKESDTTEWLNWTDIRDEHLWTAVSVGMGILEPTPVDPGGMTVFIVMEWKKKKSFLFYMRVPWTARRSNQSILREIGPGCSLEGLMFKLKLQYFGHLMRRADSLEKTLMLGKIEGRRRRAWQRMRWLDLASPTPWTWVWVNSRSWW